MPATTPDDPFADLFGKLPDPRTRALRSTGDDAVPGGAGDASPATPSPAPTAAPLSRRAAREARQAATGEMPAQASASTRPAPVPVAAAASPAETTDPYAVTSMRTPSSGRSTSEDDSPASRPGGDAGPALPYSRTGSTSIAGATEPSPAAGPHIGPTPVTTATLEDLFAGDATTDALGSVPPPKSKRRRRIGGWIALGIVLLVLGGIAGGGWYVWTTYEPQIREVMGWEGPTDYEEGLATGEVFVTIAPGDTGQPISQSLYDAGVTMTPEAFYDYLIDSGEDPVFQPGVYKLQQKMTSEAALTALMDPANKMEYTAQIPEGYTVQGTIEALAAGTGIPIEEFQAAVDAGPAAYGIPGTDSLEGWLFPATYTFDPSVTAQSAIQTLVDRTIESLDSAAVPVEDRQRILTIASIIQREARSVEDMQKVSTVIQNRLKPDNQETFGKLEMDSTAQYGYGEMHDGTASSSQAALDDPNPWNTYYHTGLPAGPIANPGDVAIDAAMHPAEGPWMYFVTVNMDTGETVFTSTYAEHQQAIRQMDEWCAANDNRGC